MNKKKIINDPIYGFISIQHELLFDCIEQPEFQRLRRIKQLGLAHLVYPGALHTRFQHAIGAMHLMSKAIDTLRTKDVDISQDEEIATLIAILLHDVGHGPFSHSLEHTLLKNVPHEHLSLKIMESLEDKLGPAVGEAIRIFKGTHPKQFLHDLVSSQLDMDRLDYLRRDSFYTGVSEGTIGLDRIIQMLNVKDDQLVVDEKGVYSIEKFIMARRFMYWQVYLHKTSMAADQMMVSILQRAKDLISKGKTLFATPSLLYFLSNECTIETLENDPEVLSRFISLDDNDIVASIKVWQESDDMVLSTLCKMLINRHLPKVKIANEPLDQKETERILSRVSQNLDISPKDVHYFVYTGKLENTAYSSHEESIRILYKNGSLSDISSANDNYGVSAQNAPTVKYFVCYPK